MPKLSAGILLYRLRAGRPEILLIHPGGPFWKNKDAGAWSIPKGEPTPGEDPLATAQREFEEELGSEPTGEFRELTPIKQKGGKTVQAWAVQGDLDTTTIQSNTFEMEWPPKSGKRTEFPEVDRAEFFDLDTARTKINPAQVAFIDELSGIIRGEAV